MKRRLLRGVTATAVLAAMLGCGAVVASAKPILMLTVKKEIQAQRAYWQQHTLAPLGPIQPPAPPCPENGLLPTGGCGIPEAVATTLPWLGNMAYYGGHVQTTPKEYLVFLGWGEKGAFPAGQPCTPENLTEGSFTATLACDPDGAGKYMADFVQQLGGTDWAGVQSQYYQTDSSGAKTNISNPAEQLAGIWVDDTNDATGLPSTSSSNPPGSTNTYSDLAAEAARAVSHFGITDLANANIIVAQPPNLSDPNALSTGYCAFHDYTQPNLEGGIYNGITPNISYTNMPYALAINSGGANVCGENAVNSDARGKLDGNSIVLGHEIEETVTDPGAEDVINGVNLGGWYDQSAWENGDKCAWVGYTDGITAPSTVPGGLNNITGNDGKKYPVQSLWSNDAAGGTGYCAGAGNDLPG
jgi:hypothetical protein